MNIKKRSYKILSLIMISMLALLVNVSAANEKAKVTVENSEVKVINKEEKKLSTELIVPYSMRSKEELKKLEEKATVSKLSGKIKKQYKDENKKGLISVLISVHYDYSEEEFETEVVKLLGDDIKPQKKEPMSYELSVTKDQIDILESMQQVWHIYSPEEDEPTSYICSEISE